MQTTQPIKDFRVMLRPNAFTQDTKIINLDQQNSTTMDLSNYTTIIGLVPFYGNWLNDINSNNVELA